MKFIDNQYYEVKGTSGHYGLAERFSSKEDAINGAKEMNEKEISLGYKPTEWIITRTTWNRCLDDDGTFVSENSSTIKMHID